MTRLDGHTELDELALYGRRIHIPTAEPDRLLPALHELLSGLDVTGTDVQPPSLEDAFVWHIGRAAANQ